MVKNNFFIDTDSKLKKKHTPHKNQKISSCGHKYISRHAISKYIGKN